MPLHGPWPWRAAAYSSRSADTASSGRSRPGQVSARSHKRRRSTHRPGRIPGSRCRERHARPHGGEHRELPPDVGVPAGATDAAVSVAHRPAHLERGLAASAHVLVEGHDRSLPVPQDLGRASKGRPSRSGPTTPAPSRRASRPTGCSRPTWTPRRLSSITGQRLRRESSRPGLSPQSSYSNS